MEYDDGQENNGNDRLPTQMRELDIDGASDDVMSTGSSAATDDSKSSSDLQFSPRGSLSPKSKVKPRSNSSSSISNNLRTSRSMGTLSMSTNDLHHSPRSMSTSYTSEGSEQGSLDNYARSESSKCLNQRNNEDKTIMKVAHISNEYVRLDEVLDRVPAQQIVEALKRRIRQKDSKAIVALSVLLPRSEYPPVERAHCVRCHKDFDPYENSNCNIRHPTNAVVKRTQDKNGANFNCTSCKQDFRLNKMFFYNEQVNAYLTGFCFSGKHSANPNDVAYLGAVKTCEEKGCVVFYV